eukprot:Pgem_evm1s11136
MLSKKLFLKSDNIIGLDQQLQIRNLEQTQTIRMQLSDTQSLHQLRISVLTDHADSQRPKLPVELRKLQAKSKMNRMLQLSDTQSLHQLCISVLTDDGTPVSFFNNNGIKS